MQHGQRGRGLDRDQLGQLVPGGDVVGHVLADEGLDDHRLLGDAVDAGEVQRTLTMHLTVGDPIEETALIRGVAAARTALHAAGWPTPGWDQARVLHADPPRESDDTGRMTLV